MKLLTCPINGTRPISEFIYGGEFRLMPDPDKATDAEWADYIFNRDNAPSVKKEWWFHSPSNTWLIAERNTVTDEITKTYLPNHNNKEADHE